MVIMLEVILFLKDYGLFIWLLCCVCCILDESNCILVFFKSRLVVINNYKLIIWMWKSLDFKV